MTHLLHYVKFVKALITVFLFSGIFCHQQGALKSPIYPRASSLMCSITPPAATSCSWARRKSQRGGIVAFSTTGSPSRSCWLTARGHRMERKFTTHCCLSLLCDLNKETMETHSVDLEAQRSFFVELKTWTHQKERNLKNYKQRWIRRGET